MSAAARERFSGGVYRPPFCPFLRAAMDDSPSVWRLIRQEPSRRTKTAERHKRQLFYNSRLFGTISGCAYTARVFSGFAGLGRTAWAAMPLLRSSCSMLFKRDLFRRIDRAVR